MADPSFAMLRDNDPILAVTAVKLLTEFGRIDDAELLQTLKHPSAAVRRAAIEHFANRSTRVSAWIHVLLTSEKAATDDTELTYMARLMMKNALEKGREYRAARDLIEENPGIPSKLPITTAVFAERVADVSLAVKTPDAAEFLLGHLTRTKLATPRAGEYLRHAALHIAPERLPALAALLTTEGRAPARPTSTGEASPTGTTPPEDPGRAGALPSGLTLPQRLALADGFAQALRQRGMRLPDEVAAWTQSVMTEALATTDEALLKRALESVRETKLDAKYEPLDRIIKDPKRTGPIRAAALEAVANLDLGPAALAGALADASSMTLRKRAAELLAQMTGNKNVQQTLLTALPTAPQELAVAIAAGLAKNDASCAALLAILESGKAAPALLRNPLVAAALEERPQPLRDRAAALTKDLPPEDARLDGVIAKRVEAFRAAQPDAAHGAQVFAQQCAVCHKLKNTGGNIGPALDGIGARGLHRLSEDILDPNRNVDPIFRQTVIETTDGQTFAGVNVRVEGELLTLTDATGKPVSVPRAKVKAQTLSKLSLMPTAFEQTLPANDFNDLLAHLLRTPN